MVYSSLCDRSRYKDTSSGVQMDYFIVCILFPGIGLTTGLISDACHGLSVANQTYNNLECPTGCVICITEVRYYQWHPDSGCPYILSYHNDGCCKHNDSRCSWVRTVTNEREDLQRNCSGRQECTLHSDRPRVLADPCNNVTISQWSSVRSIRYTCVDTVSRCPPAESPTTTRKPESTNISLVTILSTLPGTIKLPVQTGEVESANVSLATILSTLPGTSKLPVQTGEVDKSAVAGGVVGGLLALIIAISAGIFIYKRRFGRSSSEKTVITTDRVLNDNVCTPSPVQRNPGATHNEVNGEDVNIPPDGKSRQTRGGNSSSNYYNVPIGYDAVIPNRENQKNKTNSVMRDSAGRYYNVVACGPDGARSSNDNHPPHSHGYANTTDTCLNNDHSMSSSKNSGYEEITPYYKTPGTSGPSVTVSGGSSKPQGNVYEHLVEITSDNRVNVYDSLVK